MCVFQITANLQKKKIILKHDHATQQSLNISMMLNQIQLYNLPGEFKKICTMKQSAGQRSMLAHNIYVLYLANIQSYQLSK